MHKIAQDFTVRIIVSFICTSLLWLPGVSLLSEASQGPSAGKVVRPQRTRLEGTWPNLEEVKGESQLQREAPPPIPSTMRSPKLSEKPWNGRRVGDPETTGRQLDQAVVAAKRIRRAHARRRMNAPPPMYEDQFIQNFFSLALLRSATTEESLFWNNQFRVAYGQSQTSLKLAAIELGKTLFESASYAGRQRDAHSYVYDLYKTYLMREPDASGWSYWENLVGSIGRENVRRGFEESTEFAALMGTIVISGSAGSNPASLITAHVEPRNQPGHGMLARDANWGVSLISLPGRNGLDLGLALSYSSMVWTPSGPYFHFDEDNGFPSPGFRLGFPTVQRKVFNAQTAKNAYLLITPGGRRVELRQVGTSNIYEAADSSYLQLTDNSPNLLLRSTDGTQLSLVEINNEFRCTQIKDRNGNYITVSYNALGRIATISDTLGRAITFNYDIYSNLTSITQAWNGQPSHQWVSFGWSTRNMQYSFATDKVIGTTAGAPTPVITQVALNDTSYFTFDYTNSLQVSQIKNYFGGTERNATTFSYTTQSGDVPRLMSSSVSAQNWTGVNGVPTQVTTQYSVAGDGACVLTAPDGTVYKEYYGTGWQKGLTTLSEIWSGGVKQKWTTTAWTQDNTSVSYETNPRVTETNVYDASGNRRRTVIDYSNAGYAQYGLPYGVREYAADGVTEIRQTWTDYNLSQAYLDRRIIGLVSYVHISNVAQWQSKISYEYDDPARLSSLPASATQHDSAYNTSFTARGNVTSVSRWDVTDIANSSKKLTSYNNYFVTGTAASATDPANHTSTLSYTDAFSDSVIRNTFAYPTTLTDADGFSSSVQYNFDFGATTRTQSPAPAGQLQGAIQTMTYNNLGQLERVTTTNNGAYKRFWYGPNYVASYATVNNVTDELYAIQVVDGLGRVIGSAGNHPGSTGLYRLVVTVYDQMGRATSVSNPTEVNSSWVPSGDDAAGIYSTQQTYDWKGRPLVTTNPDSTTRTAAYSGCGCAGGEVVTLTDEGTIDAGVAKRRQERIYSDVLGRTVKSETLNWQGGSVYSTIVNTYNARDQVTLARQYAGTETSTAFQDTTLTYDGYGRLKSKHVPEHALGKTITWNYNADGTVQSTTDPRGATATFTYNNRHLQTNVTYTLSGSPTINVSYLYDAAGNRTSMTDQMGNVNYTYDQLSRMTTEVRYFTEPNRSYTINYGYNLSSQLTSVSYPQWSQQVGYNYDVTGRLSAVTGSGFVTGYYQGTWPNVTWIQQSVTSFASSLGYRASNSIKQLSYGNGLQLTMAYNSRLQPSQYQVSNFANSSTVSSTYDYYADGTIRYAGRIGAPQLDRAFTFDHAGRLTEALTGTEARGGTAPDGPYRESYSYDSWGNTVSRTNRLWSASSVTTNASIVNNSNQNWGYDDNGFVLSEDNSGYQSEYQYDAAGRRTRLAPYFAVVGFGSPAIEYSYQFDGDGLSSKQLETRRAEDPETGQIYSGTYPSYYLHSTILGGQVVAELDGQGNKTNSYIYAQGMRLASERIGGWPSGAVVDWEYTDPVTGSKGTSSITRDYLGTQELSTMGNDVTSPPPPPDPETYEPPIYIAPVKQTYYEIEGTTTDSYGVDASYVNMVNKEFDRHMAEVYWRHGLRDLAMAIIANNPNVGVLSRHYDLKGNLKSVSLRWGGQAADFLTGISRDIDSGRLIEQDPVTSGEVAGYQLNAPQASGGVADAGVRSTTGPCKIQVSWANSLDNYGDRYGLPTFAEIWTPGRIGQVGDLSNPDVDGRLNNGGKWEVGQKTWAWTRYQFGENGSIIQGEIPTKDDSPKKAFRTISGNYAQFNDRPGLPKEMLGTPLYNGEAKFNVLVYAQNGRQYCSASFHLNVSMVNGKAFLREVGGGHYQ